MILLLLGPPGSGKGTQAKKLWISHQWPQLSTGDIFREEIQAGTPLGLKAKSFMDQGNLVPDEITVNLIAERCIQSKWQNGFVLDGFPRTIPQATIFDRMLKDQGRNLDLVIRFVIPDEILISRLSGRRTCSHCGAMFHVDNAPPKKAGICDLCFHPLLQRKDDESDIVMKRLLVYHQQTEPLVEYYHQQLKLKNIDGSQPADRVEQQLAQAIQL